MKAKGLQSCSECEGPGYGVMRSQIHHNAETNYSRSRQFCLSKPAADACMVLLRYLEGFVLALTSGRVLLEALLGSSDQPNKKAAPKLLRRRSPDDLHKVVRANPFGKGRANVIGGEFVEPLGGAVSLIER
jgi:hypothetical protein